MSADLVATWDGTHGSWSDSSKWSTNPIIPNNGNNGQTYDVNIDTGGVLLDVDAQIEHLLVGDPDGAGSLTITGGRSLSTNAGAVLGDSTLIGFVRRGFGHVEVAGPGSSWNNTGFISLGSYGTGVLEVNDGGVVNSTSLLAGSGTGIVTPTLRGTGNVSVRGQGSRLAMADQLKIGSSLGFGTLSVDSLATVVAPTLEIGSRGSLRVDFGSSPHEVAPLSATNTASLGGSLRVSFPERPAAGVYRILDYQQLTGEFTNPIVVDNLSSSEYSLDYGSSTEDSVSLTVTPKPATASSIFWTDSQNRVVRTNLDGSALETIVSDLASPVGIDVDATGHNIYWGSSSGSAIQRAALNGSSVEEVAMATADGDVVVDHDGGKIYWTNPFNFDTIRRANLDGSNPETIVNQNGVRGIALDPASGKLYFTNYLSNTVNRANLDGSAQETLVSSQANPMNIALDPGNGRMYWSDNGFQQIRSANLDGTDVQEIVDVSLSSGRIDIALDGIGSIYWTESDSQGTLAQIKRAELDGSNIQTVVQTSNAIIRGLAVVAFATLPGDYNSDGLVDAADYTVWRNNFGQADPDLAADGNGNSTIDLDDYRIWKIHYGEIAASSPAGSSLTSAAPPTVPEPAALALVAIGLVAFTTNRSLVCGSRVQEHVR